MDLTEFFLTYIGIIVIIIILVISFIYWLEKPYSEPIVTEGKIIDKYEIKGNADTLILSDFEGFVTYNILESFNILVIMENDDRILFKISKEKYDALEIGDSVNVTEYSQVKKLVEKKRTGECHLES